MPRGQPSLFDEAPRLPEGFASRPELISHDEEARLLAEVERLPFRAFEFRQYLGLRRVVSFGFRYDFSVERLREAEPLPDFLLPLRGRAAEFAELGEDDFVQALITEYAPGAGIGWHRDKGVFGKVVGVSLAAPCTFRFRRKAGTGWERLSFTPEPRSAYLLDGPARAEWEHSIPAVETLRYSVTFRSLRG